MGEGGTRRGSCPEEGDVTRLDRWQGTSKSEAQAGKAGWPNGPCARCPDRDGSPRLLVRTLSQNVVAVSDNSSADKKEGQQRKTASTISYSTARKKKKDGFSSL